MVVDIKERVCHIFAEDKRASAHVLKIQQITVFYSHCTLVQYILMHPRGHKAFYNHASNKG